MVPEIEAGCVKFKKECAKCGCIKSSHETPGLCSAKGKIQMPDIEYPDEIKLILDGEDDLSQTYM